jgi:hypothetical protein
MEHLFILILLLALAILFFSLLSARSRKLKEYRARTILYTFLIGLLAGLIGLISYRNMVFKADTALYYLFLPWMLGIGILHIWLNGKILPWVVRKEFWAGLFHSLSIACMGGIFLLLSFKLTGHSNFNLIHLTSILLTVLPTLFYSFFLMYLNFPVKILRKWYYPVDRHIEDPMDREMELPVIVAFNFKKKSTDDTMTSFRAKAPKEMMFGKLFYYFINDYNDRNPDQVIEFLDQNKKPYDWIFYFKPNWLGQIRYIDPEETNSFNFIKENSVIICKRIIEK